MGTPDDPVGFVCFEAGDLTVYVAQALLENLDHGAKRMPFYIDGYGRFWLTFAEWKSTNRRRVQGDECYGIQRVETAGRGA